MSRNLRKCWFPGCSETKLSYDSCIHIKSTDTSISVNSQPEPPYNVATKEFTNHLPGQTLEREPLADKLDKTPNESPEKNVTSKTFTPTIKNPVVLLQKIKIPIKFSAENQPPQQNNIAPIVSKILVPEVSIPKVDISSSAETRTPRIKSENETPRVQTQTQLSPKVQIPTNALVVETLTPLSPKDQILTQKTTVLETPTIMSSKVHYGKILAPKNGRSHRKCSTLNSPTSKFATLKADTGSSTSSIVPTSPGSTAWSPKKLVPPVSLTATRDSSITCDKNDDPDLNPILQPCNSSKHLYSDNKPDCDIDLVTSDLQNNSFYRSPLSNGPVDKNINENKAHLKFDKMADTTSKSFHLHIESYNLKLSKTEDDKAVIKHTKAVKKSSCHKNKNYSFKITTEEAECESKKPRSRKDLNNLDDDVIRDLYSKLEPDSCEVQGKKSRNYLFTYLFFWYLTA